MQPKPVKGLWRKTIFRWLGAYALVVVLVVILVGVISALTIRTAENSARVEHQTKMENLRSNMDVLLVNVDQMLTLIGSDQRLNVLSGNSTPYSPYQLYMLYDLNRSFSRHIAMRGPWSSIYIYVKHGGFILFNGAKFDVPSAFRLLDYGLSSEAWQEKLDMQNEKTYMSFSSATEPGRNYIEYWFPYGSGQENDGVMVARLDILEFQRRLDVMRSFNDEILVLLDEHGRMLLSTQPLDDNLAETILPPDSSADTFVEKDGMLIGYARSKANGWTYVSILPKDFLFSRSIFTRQIAWALCVLLFVVGLVLSLLAVVQRYRPIKRLYDIAQQVSPVDESSDAFHFLETSMRDLLEKNNKVEQTLHQYHKLVLHDVLLRLFTGAKVENEEMKSAHVQFRWNRFVVFLASCGNMEDLYFGEYGSDAQKLSLVAISEVLQKKFGEKSDVYTIEHEDQILGMVNLPDDFREDKLLELAREGQQLLKSQTSLTITLVLSDVQFGLENISVGYEHAKEALECELLVGSQRGSVVRYRSDYDANTYIMDMNVPIAFSRAMKKKDFAQAKAIMNHTVDTYLSSAHPMPDMARAVMFIFVNTMLDALRTADVPLDEAFITDLQPVQRMTSCSSIRDMRMEIEKIIDEIERYVVKLRSDQERYINGIKTFVQGNYFDANLNVSGIAHEMGISVSVLSKLFKKKTDMGLLNYINHVRIDHACQLLTTTDLTLSEIAEKTGFLDSSTLIRNFKRTMGITPGKFKLENRE